MLNLEAFEVLTFDCYGTLIDWETGIWEALCPVLKAHRVEIEREPALELYGELETEAERGAYHEYADVLQMVLKGFGMRLGFEPGEAELHGFASSVKDWPAFPDSPLALQALKKKYRLAILSNIDDALFAFSARHLQVDFDWIITAQQAKSYKPSLNNFHLMLEQVGLPEGKILHVAQSLFHDVTPARMIGLSTVWVNRRKNKAGFGATPPAEARPDLEVPDLQTLAEKAGVL